MFVRTRRTPVSDNLRVFGINENKWLSGGLSPIGFELVGSGSDRPFGTTVHLWENL